MSNIGQGSNCSTNPLKRVLGFFFLTVVFFTTGASQVPKTDAVPTQTPAPPSLPVWSAYKGVTIGMTADEVRHKLGKAGIDDKDGFYYRFSDDEFAQIRIDKASKVRLISVTYSGPTGNLPAPSLVFGDAVKVTSKSDGSSYKMVRYPSAGYWVAYSRRAGKEPSVTVTLQKMRKTK